MSICIPCRDEGKGGIVAHYEADPRRNRPAMCYTHYWEQKKSDGFIPATHQPKPAVRESATAMTVKCSEKSCAFPATPSGLCAHHQRIEKESAKRWLETEPERELEPEPERKPVSPQESKPSSAYEVFDKSKIRKPYKAREHEKARELLLRGNSPRLTAKLCGLSRNSVGAIKRDMADQLPANCKCGKPNGHFGKCVTLKEETIATQEIAPKLLRGRKDGNKRYSDEQRAEVERYLREGMDVRTVAVKTGVAVATVYGIRKPIWRELPATKWPEEYASAKCDCGKPLHHSGRCNGFTKEQFSTTEEVTDMIHEKKTTVMQTTMQTEERTATTKPLQTIVRETIDSLDDLLLPPAICPIDTDTTWIDGKTATSMCTLRLVSGGDISVMTDANLFGISEYDREFLFQLIDLCRKYASKHPEVQNRKPGAV